MYARVYAPVYVFMYAYLFAFSACIYEQVWI